MITAGELIAIEYERKQRTEAVKRKEAIFKLLKELEINNTPGAVIKVPKGIDVKDALIILEYFKNKDAKYETPTKEVKQDVVNHPSHYTQGNVECIDAIESAVEGLKGIEAVCTGHVIRYIWRWPHKNGLQDLKKCRYYLDKLINKIESEEK